MADELATAVDRLQRQLEEQQRAANDTKKAINLLLKMMGLGPRFTDADEETGSTVVRADQFYGRPLATVVQEYLEGRKQAVQPDEILRGLEAGGFDFDVVGWKEPDRLRNLAISLAKNNVKFHRLKNGSFGLKAWYDVDFLKKAAKQKQASSASDADEETVVETEVEEEEKVGQKSKSHPG